MNNDLFITPLVSIPESELLISSSRAGGPGGQHVNKTNSKITIHWNIPSSQAVNDEQKMYLLEKLKASLTTNGDLIVHNSSSRSQQQNRKNALDILAKKIRQALFVPKKRLVTKVSKKLKEARLQDKYHRSSIKKMRKPDYS